MKSIYKKLGEYIRLTDERNTDLTITNLLGVSIMKEFIPSKANIIGTDLSKYKIIRTGQFAYGPVTSRNNDKLSIALLKGEDCIVSSSYLSFEVFKSEELLPEYLMLWFMRPEFDRYARFMSYGSVREMFDWESMCDVELPVPPIEEQRRIAHEYQIISDRITLLRKINERLEKLAKVQFFQLMENARGGKGVFSDVIKIMGGGTPSTSEDVYWNGDILFFTPRDIDGVFCLSTEKTLTPDGLNNCSSKLYRKNTTFITCRGTVGKVALAGVPMAMNQTCYALTGKNNYPDYFVFEFVKFFVDSIKRKANGGVFDAITTNDFESEKVIVPSIDQAKEYEKCVQPIFDHILLNEIEIKKLKKILPLIISTYRKKV